LASFPEDRASESLLAENDWQKKKRKKKKRNTRASENLLAEND